ncbi:MAG TPA: serine/threonine-protein kinase, partial [Polyangiales bacterium]
TPMVIQHPRTPGTDEPTEDRRGPPASAPLAAGTVIGQYVLEHELGSGGSGIVYAAHHHALKQRVAIKLLREEYAVVPTAVTRFMREARAVNRIGHPNIVSIIEFADFDARQPYYVMELLDGFNLRELLHREGRFSPRETLELLEPVCEAIAAAHAAGVVHRDIKASNIMVAESHGQRVIKLLDFGIAKMLDPDLAGQGLTEPGAHLGTTGHMPPEQLRGEYIDERADIYALGVLLYQLLTGEPPFHGTHPRQVALLHLQAPAPRPSALVEVPPELDAVVLRCLEKRRHERFQTVRALRDALRAAVGDARAPRATATPAVAVYVEAGGPDGEIDEDAFDDLASALEFARELLLEQGFQISLYTSNALLAVRLLASDADHAHERRQVEMLAASLQAQLDQREGAQPGLRLHVKSTLGDAQHRSNDRGHEVFAGSVFEPARWT